MKILIFFNFLIGITFTKLSKSLPENLSKSEKFETELLIHLNQNQNGNLLFSPFSLFSVLSLTANGAVGDTLNEILNTIKFDNLLRNLNSNMKRINQNVFQNNQTNLRYNYSFNLANGLFFKDQPNPLLVNIAKKFYNSTIEEMRNSSQINEYVSKMTNGRIKNIVDNQIVDDSKMIIISSIYFQSSWKYPFSSKNNFVDQFHTSESNRTNVTFISQSFKRGSVRYYENDEIQMIEIPYNFTKIRASIILPKNISLNQLINNTSKNSFNSFKQKLNTVYEVKLSLPKFKFSFNLDMKESLLKMGMLKSFDSSLADFSKLTQNKTQLFIEKILQKTFINVDENGTEAASATAATMGIRSSTINLTKMMMVNKPFIFMINHRDIEQSLFIAKIEEI